MMKKISLRVILFAGILVVALSCVLASALLSNYLANREINKFVNEHRDVLLPPGARRYDNQVPANPNQADPNQANPNQANPNQVNPNQVNPYRAAPVQPGKDYPGLNPGPQPQPRPALPLKPKNINLSFILAGVLGLVLALLGSLVIAGRISKPLSDMTRATRKIAGGDYDERVEVGGGREVEELGEAFNSLAAGLEKNEQLRRSMVADIAHELRNPLATLRGQLELMQNGAIACDREAVDSLMEDTLVLTHVVEDLRLLSEVDAGRTGFDVRAVDVAKALSDVRMRFEGEAGSKKIELKQEIEPGILLAMGDPMRLSQVLANFLSNALKNTPESGRVTMKAGTSGANILFTVRDTGSGIPPEELPLIFDRFYRTDKSRARATGGAGLGLSIARSFVSGMGGHMWAESDGEHGAAFHFTLPSAP